MQFDKVLSAGAYDEVFNVLNIQCTVYVGLIVPFHSGYFVGDVIHSSVIWCTNSNDKLREQLFFGSLDISAKHRSCPELAHR